MNKIKIIQCSYPHTGSTVLSNLIYGFLSHEEEVRWNSEELIDKYLITKTHNMNIDNWIKKYKNYKLYFIISERNDNKIKKPINKKYKKMNNVLIIKYNELLENNNNSLENIINNIFNKFNNFIPNELFTIKDKNIIKENMLNRIKLMNKVVEKMKNNSFEEYDKFTGVHGGHRNRNIK